MEREILTRKTKITNILFFSPFFLTLLVWWRQAFHSHKQINQTHSFTVNKENHNGFICIFKLYSRRLNNLSPCHVHDPMTASNKLWINSSRKISTEKFPFASFSYWIKFVDFCWLLLSVVTTFYPFWTFAHLSMISQSELWVLRNYTRKSEAKEL